MNKGGGGRIPCRITTYLTAVFTICTCPFALLQLSGDFGGRFEFTGLSICVMCIDDVASEDR